jgi:spore coat protein SA
VDRLKIIQGDRVNTIWRAATQIGDVCLKRTTTPPAVLEFTTAAHEYIFRNGGKVPELLPTAQGERFVVEGGRGIVLSGWIQGSPLVMDDAWPHLQQAVETLAHFHIAGAAFQPPAGVAPRSTLGQLPGKLEEGLAVLRQWRGGDTMVERIPAFEATVTGILRQGEEALRRLHGEGYGAWAEEATAGGGMLIHGQYRKGNALVVDDGVCVLDLEHLRHDLPLEDLRGVILGWMETQGRWKEEELEAMLAFYNAQFPLATRHRRVLLADLLFPYRYLKAARRAFHPSGEGPPPDLQAIALWEAEKARLLASLLVE